MLFKIINGYYDPAIHSIVACSILAVQDENGEISNGTMASLEHGDIVDGVFYPEAQTPFSDWMINKIPDLLGCSRAPRDGETIMKICVKNRNLPGLKHHNDLLGNLTFKAYPSGNVGILDRDGGETPYSRVEP